MKPLPTSPYVATYMARWITLLGIGSLAIVLVLSRLLATDVGEAFTRNTVLLALGWYAVALCLMMRLIGVPQPT
jgi:hypothetical protein